MTREEIVNGYQSAINNLREYENHMRRMILVDFQKATETTASELPYDKVRISLDPLEKIWVLELINNEGRVLYNYDIDTHRFTIRFTEKHKYNELGCDGKVITPFKHEKIYFHGTTVKLN